MVSKQLRLDVAQLTDVGRRREHNEDNMAYVIPKDLQVMTRKGALFIVADGMGGHAAGEVASEIAVDTISNVYYQDDDDDVTSSLLHAIKRANALIHQRAAENMLRSGMGTTCVAAVLRGDMAYIANVGDSRAYLVRNGLVKQISQDHSWVGEQVRAGLLTEEQARTHAQRNVITRSLGTQPDVEIDIFSEPLQEGDFMVLCTDGLSGLVSDEEIQRTVAQARPQESVYHLVERANENGGPDNITAIVIAVQEVGVEPPGVRRPVYAGGHESSEDTANLGNPLNGTATPSTMYGDGNRIPSNPLRLSSGPLPPDAIDTAPQPLVSTPARQRNRLFISSLALVVLIILAVVASAAYFLHKDNSAAIDQNLQTARQNITKANGEVSTNPTAALHDYAGAQSILRSLLSSSLSGDQNKQVTQLQNTLTAGVRSAITSYNSAAAIVSLPCLSTLPSQEIKDNATGTHAKLLAWVQLGNNKSSILYAVGQDNKLYQIDNNSLILQDIAALNKVQIQAVAGLNSHLLILTSQVGANNTTTYTLHVLSAGQQKVDMSIPIDPKYLKDGLQPTLLAASDTDVYVLLTSSSVQSSASLLDYAPNSKTHQLTPGAQATFSVSNAIVSMVAFPGHQVFLLLADGSVKSVSVLNGSQETTSVLVKDPINPPLAVDASTYASPTPVPTVTAASSTALSVPGTTASGSLATGMVAGSPHLYLMDVTLHRVLDLKAADGTTAGGTASPVATVPTTSGGAGGGTVNGPPTKLQLVKQYTSSSLFAQMKSITVDSLKSQVDVLTQNASSTTSLTSFSVAQQNGC